MNALLLALLQGIGILSAIKSWKLGVAKMDVTSVASCIMIRGKTLFYPLFAKCKWSCTLNTQ